MKDIISQDDIVRFPHASRTDALWNGLWQMFVIDPFLVDKYLSSQNIEVGKAAEVTVVDYANLLEAIVEAIVQQ